MSSPLWARCFTFLCHLTFSWLIFHSVFCIIIFFYSTFAGFTVQGRAPLFSFDHASNFARSHLRERKNPVVWCETFAEGNNKVLHLLTHNDRGEQERAQSRKREGLGETAPAPGVRPERTFKDWAGLCGDPRVSVGELCENGAQASRRSCTMDSIKSKPPHLKEKNLTNKQTANLFSMHGASAFPVLHDNSLQDRLPCLLEQMSNQSTFHSLTCLHSFLLINSFPSRGTNLTTGRGHYRLAGKAKKRFFAQSWSDLLFANKTCQDSRWYVCSEK